MLSNAYFLAKFRFDTAENEPAKIANFCKQDSNQSTAAKVPLGGPSRAGSRRGSAPRRGRRAAPSSCPPRPAGDERIPNRELGRKRGCGLNLNFELI